MTAEGFASLTLLLSDLSEDQSLVLFIYVKNKIRIKTTLFSMLVLVIVVGVKTTM